jgi:hypothetical protein
MVIILQLFTLGEKRYLDEGVENDIPANKDSWEGAQTRIGIRLKRREKIT